MIEALQFQASPVHPAPVTGAQPAGSADDFAALVYAAGDLVRPEGGTPAASAPFAMTVDAEPPVSSPASPLPLRAVAVVDVAVDGDLPRPVAMAADAQPPRFAVASPRAHWAVDAADMPVGSGLPPIPDTSRAASVAVAAEGDTPSFMRAAAMPDDGGEAERPAPEAADIDPDMAISATPLPWSAMTETLQIMQAAPALADTPAPDQGPPAPMAAAEGGKGRGPSTGSPDTLPVAPDVARSILPDGPTEDLPRVTQGTAPDPSLPAAPMQDSAYTGSVSHVAGTTTASAPASDMVAAVPPASPDPAIRQTFPPSAPIAAPDRTAAPFVGADGSPPLAKAAAASNAKPVDVSAEQHPAAATVDGSPPLAKAAAASDAKPVAVSAEQHPAVATVALPGPALPIPRPETPPAIKGAVAPQEARPSIREMVARSAPGKPNVADPAMTEAEPAPAPPRDGLAAAVQPVSSPPVPVSAAEFPTASALSPVLVPASITPLSAMTETVPADQTAPQRPEQAVPVDALPALLLSRTDGGPAEIHLEPLELGRLRLDVIADGQEIQVTLAAERSDTTDLLRRFASELAAEFRQAGFVQVTVGFGAWGDGRGESRPQVPPQPPQAGQPGDPQTITAQAVLLHVPQARLPARGLNLRL